MRLSLSFDVNYRKIRRIFLWIKEVPEFLFKFLDDKNPEFLINPFIEEMKDIDVDRIKLLFYLKNQRAAFNFFEGGIYLNFGVPVDIFFIEKLIEQGVFVKLGENEFPLRRGDGFWEINFEFRDEMTKIVPLNIDNVFLLPTNSIYLVFDEQTHLISPLKSPFSSAIIDEIFEEGCYYLKEEERHNFIFDSALRNRLAGVINFPEINVIDGGRVNFDIFIHNDEFKLEAFIKVRDYRIPLDFKRIREKLMFGEKLVLECDKRYFVIEDESFYDTLRKITSELRKNFFSLLNEIRGNTVYSKDIKTLFCKVLPEVREMCDIKVNSKDVNFLTPENSKISVEISPSERADWFSIDFKLKFKDVELTTDEFFLLIKTGVVLKDSLVITLSDEEMKQINKLMKKFSLIIRENKGRLPKSYLPFFIRMKEEINFSFPKEGSTRLVDFEEVKKVGEVPIPSEIGGYSLREYQKEAIRWLHFLRSYGSGGILADEMGLGKTLEVLSFLYIVREEIKPTLIVCPSALIYNWANEITKFFKDKFRFLLVVGEKKKRQSLLEKLTDYELIITSYSLLTQDENEYSKIRFVYCIIDEAQHIKNKGAKKTLSVKKINAVFKIALTGTPLENYPSELWSIFDFVIPGYLGSYQWFKKNIETPIEKWDEKERIEVLETFRSLISPYILRRTKNDVLKELPSKVDQDLKLELTEKQKLLYIEVVRKAKKRIFSIVEEKGIERSYIEILAALTRLRQICLHPGLVDEAFLNDEESSSKMNAIIELIYEAMDSGHKVVVYSQFVEFLKLVKIRLAREEVDYLYMDGRSKNRVELVNYYNESSVPVLLASIKAGGVGLNITGADNVIIADPWWNPAVEEQAIDRLHRIGQKNVVFVYRLITSGTIEEKIRLLQLKKKKIINEIMEPSFSFLKSLSLEELSEIFSFE